MSSSAVTCTADGSVVTVAALTGAAVVIHRVAAAITAATVLFLNFMVYTPCSYIINEQPPKRLNDGILLSFQYLCSVGADTDHAYMAAYQLFETGDVALAVCGELIEACAL